MNADEHELKGDAAAGWPSHRAGCRSHGEHPPESPFKGGLEAGPGWPRHVDECADLVNVFEVVGFEVVGMLRKMFEKLEGERGVPKEQCLIYAGRAMAAALRVAVDIAADAPLAVLGVPVLVVPDGNPLGLQVQTFTIPVHNGTGPVPGLRKPWGGTNLALVERNKIKAFAREAGKAGKE